MFGRPSKKEIYNKVKNALDAVRDGNRVQALSKHTAMGYDFLDVNDESEFWSLLEKLLDELLKEDPVKHYAGARPPQPSYEPQLKNKELWAYVWDSSILSKTIYLKFCYKNNFYFHVDCHENQNK